MKTVYKYKLNKRPGSHKLIMPEEYKIIHFNEQNGEPVIWALVNEVNAFDKMTPNHEEVHIYLSETGGYIPDNPEYIGTIHLLDGNYVLHAFKINNP